ncbi:MAG: NAD(P)H-dependent oxidoreductase [Candidatus Sulfotelmatobacter sp.]
MNSLVSILGIAGSLRRDSYNRMALRTAQQLAPDDAKIEIFDLAAIPLFNQDEEKTPPAAVTEFKKRIRAADAILIATPEYNFGIPGVLKNAIDWGSRPYGDNSWNDKPVAIMGASPGLLGTARAQLLMRHLLTFVNMHTVNQPEVMIAKANEKFDASGNLTDETSQKLMRQLLQNLVNWTRRLGKGL